METELITITMAAFISLITVAVLATMLAVARILELHPNLFRGKLGKTEEFTNPQVGPSEADIVVGAIESIVTSAHLLMRMDLTCLGAGERDALEDFQAMAGPSCCWVDRTSSIGLAWARDQWYGNTMVTMLLGGMMAHLAIIQKSDTKSRYVKSAIEYLQSDECVRMVCNYLGKEPIPNEYNSQTYGASPIRGFQPEHDDA